MKSFSEFKKTSNLSELVYKTAPDFNDHRVMTREVVLFDMSQPFDIDPPVANDSEEVYVELMEIADHMELTLFEHKQQAEEYDTTTFSSAFINYCTENGLPINESKIVKMTKEMGIIGRQVKYQFNRPRPAQIAEARTVKFPEVRTNTGHTPSYPSGHALASRVFSLYLGNIFPSHKQEFLNIEEQIGLSRIRLGVHFPSDIEAGTSVGNQLYQRLKDKT